jgi:hypothetical protein
MCSKCQGNREESVLNATTVAVDLAKNALPRKILATSGDVVSRSEIEVDQIYSMAEGEELVRDKSGRWRNELQQFGTLKRAPFGEGKTLGGSIDASIKLFEGGTQNDVTVIPLVGEGDFVNMNVAKGLSGAGEIGKGGLNLNVSARATTEIRYGESIQLPGWLTEQIPELSGSVDARSVLDLQGDLQANLGKDGVELGAGFRAEAAAVQAPFELTLTKDFGPIELSVGVKGALNLGGIGGALNVPPS